MRTSSKVLPMTVLLAWGFLACAAGAAAQGSGGAGLRVTVLLYSGRPSPSFTLDAPAELDRLRQLLAAGQDVTAAPGGSVLPSILGYNGLLIENRSGAGGLPASFAVYKNRVEIRGAQRKVLTDNGGLEQFLLDKAIEKQALKPEERRFLEASRPREKP
jgi:hypothetical protein